MEINNEGKAAIFTTPEGELYSLSQTADNRVILYNIYKPLNIETPLERFNLNINKLIKAVNCVNKTAIISSLIIDNNTISYKDDLIKFNIRLLNDKLLTVPKINIANLKTFPFTSEISIDAKVIMEIKRAMDFINTSDKFYIEIEDNKLYFLFGDKNDTSHSSDEIRILVSDKFTGEIPSKIFNTDILKLLYKAKSDIVVKIGQHALMISIENDDNQLHYITTSLKK